MPIYIRRKTTFLMRGSKIKGILTLESREGSRGSWCLTGDENGVFDFPTEEARDAKIAELVAKGAVLKGLRRA